MDGEPIGNSGADAESNIDIDGSTIENANGAGEPDGGSSAIDPGSYVREPGKRGRHPNGCPCDKCAAKRAGGIGFSEQVRTSSSKGPKPKTAQLDIETFGRQIVGAHAIAGLLLKSNIPVINDVQGKELAIAIRDLAAQYDIKPNPRTMAWLKMAGVSAMVYGPKIMLVAQQQKMEREKRHAQQRAGMPPMQPAPKPPAPAPNGSMGGISFPNPFGSPVQ